MSISSKLKNFIKKRIKTSENKRYAILIGYNDYDFLPKLRCSVNDVSDMEKILTDERIGGFTDTLVFSKGEPILEILPKMEEIIVSTAGPKDVILVYFSGHGCLDSSGRLYLATKNTKETILDSSSIALDHFLNYIDRSKCRTILLILDCCYSGATRGVSQRSNIDESFAAANQARGLYIMTSSTDIENSKEEDKNSIFTKFLVEGLQTGDADLNNDGVITIDEAYNYAYNLVKRTGLQTPVKFCFAVKGDPVLARNIFYRPLEPPDPSLKDQYDRFIAIKNMIDMLNSKEPPLFAINLSRYYIEGEMYLSGLLAVSHEHTPNIRQTQTGFECDAFFEPHMLSSHAKEGKETIKGRKKVSTLFEGKRVISLMKVRMKVYSEDISIINMLNRDGTSSELFFGPRKFTLLDIIRGKDNE